MENKQDLWQSQNQRIKWIIRGGLDWDKLTEWEQSFIESIEQQSDNRRILTDRQMEKLEDIYEKKGV